MINPMLTTPRFQCLQQMGLYTILILLSTTISEANIIEIWAVGDGEKVFKYDTEHYAKIKNSIWDGSEIKLRGLYNEVLSFQVIVILDSLGAQALEVSITPPYQPATGDRIGVAGLGPYGDKGGLELFTQHYLHVTRPTPSNWFYGSKNSAPEKMTGWIPDALIPVNARVGQGGFPVMVPPTQTVERRHQNQLEITERPAKQNQGFWVDVYLPRDRNLSAGNYESTIYITESGSVVAELPLKIELIDAYLPDENHSNVWVYCSDFGALEAYFPGYSAEEIERMLKFEAKRHRIELVGASLVHRSAFDVQLMEHYRPFLDGSAYSPAEGYHGPGQYQGEKLFPVGMYGSRVLGNSETEVQRESDKWVHWFEENAPGVKYFWYLIDEPGPVQFPWIKERSQWLKSNPGPGQRMPIHITRGYTEELKYHIDIWNEYDGVKLERQQELWDQQKDYWFYNGNRPRYGSVILEGTAVDLRVNGWIKYLFNINTWFVWHSTHWTHNGQGPKGRLMQRIFNEPLTFINWDLEYGNGDGILFYPGQLPHQPQEDRGLFRAMPSIRLKNIRRGQQDYELLWLVAQKSGRQQAIDIARKLVGKAMNEVEMSDRVYWPQRGDNYDDARDQLIDILSN